MVLFLWPGSSFFYIPAKRGVFHMVKRSSFTALCKRCMAKIRLFQMKYGVKTGLPAKKQPNMPVEAIFGCFVWRNLF